MPSRVNLGDLPIHVHTSGGASGCRWVARQSTRRIEPQSQSTRVVYSLNLSYVPTAVAASAGCTESDNNSKVKRRGTVCLTSGRRARSVVTMEAVRTQHGQSAEQDRGGVVVERRVFSTMVMTSVGTGREQVSLARSGTHAGRDRVDAMIVSRPHRTCEPKSQGPRTG